MLPHFNLQGSDSSDDESSDDDSEAGFGGGTINRDGTLSSASVHELRLLKALSKGPSTGRFGGREAKMARIREQVRSSRESDGRQCDFACLVLDSGRTATSSQGPLRA